MKKGRFDETYWLKIKNKVYPYHHIADEIIAMLYEESLNEKYLNYTGKFHRTIRANEIVTRLKDHGMIRRIPPLIEISRTIRGFLEHYHKSHRVEYEHKKRGYVVNYSRNQLDVMIKDIINIVGDISLLYAKAYSSS